MNKRKKLSPNEFHSLGLDQSITRRDFLNASLLGAGATLLDMASPINLFSQEPKGWDGYGGVGDYANSHGNTAEVVHVAHQLRDGMFDPLPKNTLETGEIFDLVIIGGGMAGLAAGYQFKKTAGPKRTCLILDNHPIFGGEAKQNEFIVNGQRLIGPQGSNDFTVPNKENMEAEPDYDCWDDLGIPRQFKYQSWDCKLKPLEFPREQYGFMLWGDRSPSIGYYFDERSFGGHSRWASDIWDKNLQETPYSAKVRKDFMTWRTSLSKYYSGHDYERWLDSITYKDYLEKVMGLGPEVTRFADPILAGAIGLGCDVISAYAAYSIAMPGFNGLGSGFKAFSSGDQEFPMKLSELNFEGFPGGNSGFARHFMKYLVPDSIAGEHKFEDIINGGVNFEALDRPSSPVRVRLSATAVSVEHDSAAEKATHVRVAYCKGGRTYLVKGRTAVLASGNWINQHIIGDLPEEYHAACRQFYRSPMLVVNVALNNWRFLYKLGLTGCIWFDGFGFSCCIATPMIVGDYHPELRPDKPIILTFYVPFYYPGNPIGAQGSRGRAELFSTSYLDYERQIREHMVRLFSPYGFDPRRDIAGIILNRWGHAYVDPQPGFHFGLNGKPTPSDVIRKRFGRIAIGHSELRGHQSWIGAVTEGRRAARQVLEVMG